MGNSTINKAIAAAIAAGLAAPAAHAGVILSESLSVSQLLAAPGSAYSGTFSIGNLLSQNSLSGATISNATLTAYGYSDAVFNQVTSSSIDTLLGSYSTNVVTGYYSYSYGCGWGETCYAYGAYYGYALYRTTLDTTTVTQTDSVPDTMVVQTGTDNGAGSDSGQTPTTVNGPENYAGTQPNGTYGYDTYYDQTNTVSQGFYGALSASTTLDAPELYQLGLTDSLDFTVTDAAGAMNLNSISLSFDATPSSSTAVPEPGAAVLFAAALAALAEARRRSKAKA